MISLREAQQGQPRLRIETRAPGVAVSRFCLRELAAQPMDLRLLIPRPSSSAFFDIAHAAFDRAPRLFLGLGPGSAYLQDLGAVGEAVPGKQPQLRMILTPGRQRRRPL